MRIPPIDRAGADVTRRGASRRKLGQNFLAHATSARKIVALLGLDRGAAVLEIGPGRGALTDLLVEAAGRVAAVELDAKLAEALRVRYDPARFLLIQDDILEVELGRICELLDSERLIVVGNLPYGISKPVSVKLIRERARVDRAVLMFQREVALRLTARPGERSYGPLGVLAGTAFRIQREFDLPPSCFRPSPKVMSSVTSWIRQEQQPAQEELDRLRRCLGACFASRRKTLRNNLRTLLGDDQLTDHSLQNAGIDGSLRAESLTREQFIRLSIELPASTG